MGLLRRILFGGFWRKDPAKLKKEITRLESLIEYLEKRRKELIESGEYEEASRMLRLMGIKARRLDDLLRFA
jgi:hypothetical protein